MPPAFGRYELLGPIASGGMASVHLARVRGEAGFERYVALKRMLPEVENDEAFVAMFLDEARLAAGIRHPNVVGVLDLDRNELGPYLVMEFFDGPSLSTLLKGVRARREEIPLAVALRIALDLLAGLHAAHELRDPAGRPLGIVHRDVSPSNLLVARDGVSRLTDFGIARAEARLARTEVGELKGKLPYMAPEQLRGTVADRRADVYAAGCVLWEILTLRRAFDGDDHAAILAAVLAGPRATVSEAGRPIPPALDAALGAALASREGRYPTARAFAESLERAAERSRLELATAEQVADYVRARHGTLLTAERLAPCELDVRRAGPPRVVPVASDPVPEAGETAAPLVNDSASQARAGAQRVPRTSLAIAAAVTVALGALATFVLVERRGTAPPGEDASVRPATPSSPSATSGGEGPTATGRALPTSRPEPLASTTPREAMPAPSAEPIRSRPRSDGSARATSAPPPPSTTSAPRSPAGFDPKTYRPGRL